MMDRQIVGIDHGNRNIKTGNTIFLNNINELSTKPDDLSRVLEYKDRFFEIGGVPEGIFVTGKRDYLPVSKYPS